MESIFKKQDSNTIEILKWIAIVSMVIDHMGLILFEDIEVLRYIGRLAFPLFGFILIHNYLFFTSNKLKYIKRLWIFAAISQPFFWVVVYESLNIFVLFALALSVIYFFEKIENMDRKNIEKFLTQFILIIFTLFFSYFIDYGPLGFVFLLSTYLSFISYRYIAYNFLSLFLINSFPMSFMGLFYVPVVYISKFIRIKIKRINKWFFYSFYPAHILIFGVIKYL